MCVCHSHTHIIKPLLSKYLDCDIIFNTGHSYIISFSLERHSQREQDRRQCEGENGRGGGGSRERPSCKVQSGEKEKIENLVMSQKADKILE